MNANSTLGNAARMLCRSALPLWMACFTVSAAVRDVKLLRAEEKRLTVDLTIGQILTVHTAPVPLTAFRWVHVPAHGKVMEFLEAEADAGTSDESLPGRLQNSRFLFRAASIGCTCLTFAYFAGHSFPGFEQRDKFHVKVCVSR